MMNLVLLAAALTLGGPSVQPASMEIDVKSPVIAVCSEETATVAPAAFPGPEAPISVAPVEPEATFADSALRGDQDWSIRYCCTPQQVNACAATGGTTTCRTGVCQCQF